MLHHLPNPRVFSAGKMKDWKHWNGVSGHPRAVLQHSAASALTRPAPPAFPASLARRAASWASDLSDTYGCPGPTLGRALHLIQCSAVAVLKFSTFEQGGLRLRFDQDAAGPARMPQLLLRTAIYSKLCKCQQLSRTLSVRSWPGSCLLLCCRL